MLRFKQSFSFLYRLVSFTLNRFIFGKNTSLRNKNNFFNHCKCLMFEANQIFVYLFAFKHHLLIQKMVTFG